jgi:hypothetical protein
MAAILNSTTIGGFIAPTDSTDTYSTHDAIYGRGGLRSVANESGRLAITEDRRAEGMLVWQVDTGVMWQLDGGITNSDWAEYSSSDTNIANSNLTFDNNRSTSLSTYGFTILDSSFNPLAYFSGTDSRVGIGTASPTDLFHVAGDAKVDGVLKLEPLSEAPSAVAGGLYADNENHLFFGVSA